MGPKSPTLDETYFIMPKYGFSDIKQFIYKKSSISASKKPGHFHATRCFLAKMARTAHL